MRFVISINFAAIVNKKLNQVICKLSQCQYGVGHRRPTAIVEFVDCYASIEKDFSNFYYAFPTLTIAGKSMKKVLTNIILDSSIQAMINEKCQDFLSVVAFTKKYAAVYCW